ncbi:MAG: hypothetical protein QOG19_118 [Mycobacterium sp.]|jgi:hypothetical protein|nr:hypothetical protein [Mycobacterium sp.]
MMSATCSACCRILSAPALSRVSDPPYAGACSLDGDRCGVEPLDIALRLVLVRKSYGSPASVRGGMASSAPST